LLTIVFVVVALTFALSGCSDSSDDLTTPSGVPTLHAILAIDDTAADIGAAVDRNSINAWLNAISQNTGLLLNTIELTGNGGNLRQSYLTAAINNLDIGSNDVIVFYYSGHGGSDGDRNALQSRWPVLIFLNDEEVRFDEVQQSLRAKEARFTMVIADCCNNYPDQAKIGLPVPRGNTDNYQTLFFQYRGYILLSASSPGEFSLGGDDGGMFTNQFLDAFYTSAASGSPSWDSIVYDATQKVTQDLDGEPPFQPQSESSLELL
jgi:hypothetical protein